MKDTISFDDLMKVDVRMGKVTSAEPIEGADRLIKLEVNFGEEIGTKTVASAIAHKGFTPEYMEGKTFPFVLNLEPRKIRGVLSEAMIMMSEDASGKYVSLENSAEPGSVVL